MGTLSGGGSLTRPRFRGQTFKDWLWCFFQGEPHELISRRDTGPYLLRWYLLPRFRWLKWINVYLHKFVADDELEALHDHPRASLSLLFLGEYREITPGGVRIYRAPALIKRRADHRHRIELINGKPAWTLFIMGPKVREWGFWCPHGFRHWTQFHANLDENKLGCE